MGCCGQKRVALRNAPAPVTMPAATLPSYRETPVDTSQPCFDSCAGAAPFLFGVTSLSGTLAHSRAGSGNWSAV